MVAAIQATPSTAAANKSPEDLTGGNPIRPPLIPSEKDNAVASRRRRTKEITSRYLTYSSPSPSSSTSSSSTTSSSTLSSRRFPSPVLTPRPANPPGPAQPKRSHSVDRTRPATLRAEPRTPVAEAPPSAAARALCTTTRSLSVSFQGESFFYRTSKAKVASPFPGSNRKPTPERRRSTTPSRANAAPGDQSENSRPSDLHCRWPAAKARQSNPLARSLDCSLERKEPMLLAVRLLQQSMVFEDGARRASFDGGDLSASSDTDSVSSGSNSGTQEPTIPPKARATPRGISVPARFWQETSSRLRRLPQPSTPISSPTSRTPAAPKPSSVKRSLVDSPVSSPHTASSPLRGPMRPSSPTKLAMSPLRGMASPSRMRNGAAVGSMPIGQPGIAPSIISFAAEVRRAKKGESRIEEAHLLRLYDNRHMQWRWVNARASTALLVQQLTAEKNLHNAWITISEMRDSVTIKRIKLQLLTQNVKLTSILKGQMICLEEWSLLDRDHSSSLSGAIEALKASTLRLPVVGGARADIQEVKNAVCSAVDVMQTMVFSIRVLLSKVEGMSSLVSELVKVAAEERALLDQSRDLLSIVTAMHVKQCSLRSHLLQLKRKASQFQR